MIERTVPWVLANSRSVFVPVITARMKRGDTPILVAKVEGGVATVRWPDDRFLVLAVPR